MKKSSNEIFKLIKSMTRSEKRYFQLYASRHVQGEKNNYLQLYEVINQLEVYDEEVIKQKFPNEKMSDYLPAAKYYLFNLILDCLHSFNENTSPVAKARKKLHHAEILYHKGLTDQSRKILQKLKTQANQQEKFPLAIEIIGLEKHIISRGYFKDLEEADLQRIFEEEEELIAKLENLNNYWFLHGSVYLLHFRKGALRQESEAEKLEEIASSELLNDPSKALSFRALMDYLHTRAIYHFSRGEISEAYNFNKEFLDLMHSQPQKIEEHPRRYLSVFNNYLIDSLNMGNYEELEEGIKKLRSLNDSQAFQHVENAGADIFRLSYILELNSCINRGQFEEAEKVLPLVAAGLEKYENLIVKHNVVTLHYLSAYIHFGLGNYKEALKCVNKILNDNTENMVQDVYSFARLLHLIIHFELGNYDVLEYAIKSASRYLKQRERLFAVEKLLLQFLKKQANASPGQSGTILDELYKKLIPLKQDPFESRAFQYFDFILWIENKRINKSLSGKDKRSTTA